VTRDEDFRIRPGRIGDRGARGRTFVNQVLAAAVRAGYAIRGARRPGRTGRGRAAALAAGLRTPGRRVVVKARIVRHAGRAWRAAPLGVHLRYLQRDGVDRDGATGRIFDAAGRAEAGAFAARCEPDRHHFRLIVSPEDAAQLADLPAFARALMRQAEVDLGTRLDWVAVEHRDTAHPHLHVLVRGIADDGRDLVIARDYLARGLRRRAEGLVTLELGPRSAREIAAALQRETSAERWTRLDTLLAVEVREGRVDLRTGPADLDLRAMLLGRAAALERLGLAQAEGRGVWRLHADHGARLRDLALRNDIIATLHRSFGEGRALADLAPFAEQAAAPILGRVAGRGLRDDLSGEAYLLVDGVDGRAHHVRLRDLGAAGDTPVDGLVEVFPDASGARVVHRSDLSVAAQVGAEAATWLDRQLLAREPAALAEGGFGGEVGAALAARREHLVRTGLAQRSAAGRVSLAPGLLGTLRARELATAGARLAREHGLAFDGEAEDPDVRGRYLRRVALASGRFAMIEDGLGFRLVPWARALDRRLGQEVRGTLGPGGMHWDLGRGRGR
jgi:type IV secretory pathway VirD2 relaxase